MQGQYTVEEIHHFFSIEKSPYLFWLDGRKVEKLLTRVKNGWIYDYQITLDDGEIIYNQGNATIEVRPKTPRFTELQDPNDLDATLPIIPAETAQRDHDEIQRLRAENAKMRGLLEGLAKFKDSKNGNLRHFATRAWNLLNRN